MTSTPISSMTSPPTTTGYRATAITVAVDPLATGSSASRLGASPDASCHEPVAPPSRFFLPPSWVTGSLSMLTTDHAPAAVPEVAGAAGSTFATGSAAGLGAGVHD